MTVDGQAPLHHEIILYATPDGAVRVEVLFEGETFWLTQRRMADLFGVGVQTINHHLQEIYKSHELNEMATIRKYRIVQTEGTRAVSREVDFYNLDAIIGVGYRVNSREATQFRIWATQVLREYLIKGFVLDDERLKQGKRLGKDYFDELLERIRSIRASERRFYLKITDIIRTVQHRLQPECRDHAGVLQDSAEQVALGDYRQNGSRGDCRARPG
jgi:hypothetical protein